jgi:hypothetical protein
VSDVPYSSLLNRRIPVSGREVLPETAGVYAWWFLDDIRQATADADGAGVRPLYLGAARNLAAQVADDAVGLKDTPLRMGLALLMGEHIGLAPRTAVSPRPLKIAERQRMDHWISANLLVSWSELPHPAAYRDALARALDPLLRP